MKFKALALIPLTIALAGCESASRFAGFDSPQPVAALPAPMPGPAIAAPTSPVTSQPLPPLAGTAPPPGGSISGGPVPGGQQVAALPPASAPIGNGIPAAPAVPSVRGLAGNWKISDAARGNCAISLTQAPLLDLYRANPSGCQAGSLAKVDAWQQRGQEIVLLEPGGRTAVRLFPKGDGTYEGAATTSGAVVRMSR